MEVLKSEEYDIRKKTRRLIKIPELNSILKRKLCFSIDEMNYVLNNFVNTKIIEKNENYINKFYRILKGSYY